MKLIVKIMIALALLGGILLGIGLKNGGELYTSLQDGELHTFQDTVEQIDRGTEPVDPEDDYDYFDISVDSGSCTVKTGRYLAYSNDVAVRRNDANAIFFDVTSENAEIVLPAHKLPRLDIHVTDGSVQTEDLYTDELRLFCTNATLTVEEAEADSCSVGAEKATIHIDDLDTAQLEIGCDRSDLTLDVDGDPDEYYCISEITDSTVTWDGDPLDRVRFGDTDAPRALTLTVTEGQVTFDP
ncbi:MAG: hypothetical protein IJ042_03145 [Butyricicoccus sp.]|nr:hypothetical protein [Butyricicoccus sp.]